MRVHIASTNPAKVRQLSEASATCGVEMAPIDPTRLPAVEEDSLDPVGNARKKGDHLCGCHREGV